MLTSGIAPFDLRGRQQRLLHQRAVGDHGQILPRLHHLRAAERNRVVRRRDAASGCTARDRAACVPGTAPDRRQRIAVRSRPQASAAFEGNTTRSPGMCVNMRLRRTGCDKSRRRSDSRRSARGSPPGRRNSRSSASAWWPARRGSASSPARCNRRTESPATGFSPRVAMPMARPTMAASASGVLKTRRDAELASAVRASL